MSRYLIQSAHTFQFLYPHPVAGVGWTPSLVTALRDGVVRDLEDVAQLLEDHVDRGIGIVIDLDADY